MAVAACLIHARCHIQYSFGRMSCPGGDRGLMPCEWPANRFCRPKFPAPEILAAMGWMRIWMPDWRIPGMRIQEPDSRSGDSQSQIMEMRKMQMSNGFSSGCARRVCPAVCPSAGSSAGLGDVLPPGGAGVGVDVRQVIEASRPVPSDGQRTALATPGGGASTDARPIATTNGLGRTGR